MADGTTRAKPRSRRPKPLTTPDPIEIAMAAAASARSPEGVAAEVLRKQSILIGWQIASERAAFGLRVLGALAALGLGALLAWAAWDASRASGIVVRPFETSSTLAAQGFSGESTANELVSRVAALQAATSSARQERRSASSTDEVALVIPQTGISVGEAQRLLREGLGHETTVSGALRRAAGGGLTLSLRVDGRLVPVTPPPSEQIAVAEAWLDRAAEAVMRETDGYRYHVWLATIVGRDQEAMELARRLTLSGPPKDRAWAWSGLSQQLRNEGRRAESIAALKEAVRLDPGNVTAWGNLTSAELSLGHEEAAYGFARRGNRESPTLRTPGAGLVEARLRQDWSALEARAERSISAGRTANAVRAGHVYRALSFARRHDVSGARFATANGAFRSLEGPNTVQVEIAMFDALDDWVALERLMLTPWEPGPRQARANLDYDPVLRTPWRAYAVARQGRVAEAQAMIATTPMDCALCVRMRGRIAALAGQAAQADRWFAEATRQAPSLADAEYQWGAVKLARGDAQGALALFRVAARKAPGWAEPLKGEGDALVRLGQTPQALRSYAAAAERAPRWGGLQVAWGEALAARGKRNDAQAKWRAATGMDLTPGERARVQALLQTAIS